MDEIEKPTVGFDPLGKANLAAQVICRGDRRKYYRFRPAKFYGEFSALTGAVAEGFQLQLQALENLARFGVKTHPAVMISFSSPEAIDSIKKRLGKIRRDFGDIEIEELLL
jgi:uncharacterized Fe-S cluster-containing radical SAM superfamily protein